MVTINNIKNEVKGDDITSVVTVYGSDGNALDVSSSTSTMTIKETYGGAIFSQVSGAFVTDGTDGKIEFNIPHTDTDLADVTVLYHYDAQITLSSGRKYTVIKGTLEFLDEVTEL